LRAGLGEAPSAELRLPDELFIPRCDAYRRGAIGASAPAASAVPAAAGKGARQTWYGFTRSGRRSRIPGGHAQGQDLDAVYAIGPGINEDQPAEWTRRKGRRVDDELVFDEKDKSKLRFRPRADGGLSATWTSPDGKTSMEAGLRRLDPQRFPRHAEVR
jgi:hypothetical protein